MRKNGMVLVALTACVSLALLFSALRLAAQSKATANNAQDTHSHAEHGSTSHAGMTDSAQMEASIQAMSGGHADMGPHMKMSKIMPIQPGDQERADKIARELRTSIEKYKDYKVALADGYRIFLPNVPAPMMHFNNFRYVMESSFRFNASHPPSLLYEPDGKGGYRLIGAMYTAPQGWTEDDLNSRIPLSVAQWHQHVNMCAAPQGQQQQRQLLSRDRRFGLGGSISTRKDCDAAGGQFFPVVFNWMVHVYPFESDPKKVWEVERQMPGGHHH